MSEGVACTVKPPVFLGSGGGSSASVRLSGVCVVDVLLPPAKTVDIESISFKNFYTASLSVRLLRRGPGREGEGAGSSAKWCTALRDRPLMTNPHTEGGAHDYCHIHWKQLRTSAERVSCVRLILKQPSRCWSRFGVEDVRLCPRAPLAVCAPSQPASRHPLFHRLASIGKAFFFRSRTRSFRIGSWPWTRPVRPRRARRRCHAPSSGCGRSAKSRRPVRPPPTRPPWDALTWTAATTSSHCL
ncbi:nicolin-1 isoform X2 [Stigmatopora argus]